MAKEVQQVVAVVFGTSRVDVRGSSLTVYAWHAHYHTETNHLKLE